jgi:hypothetical protein
MSDANSNRQDPIGEKYFRPLEAAERFSDVAFYVAAFLSFAALLVEKTEHPALYDVVQICFVLSVIFVFVVGIAIRLYWRPIAEDKRRAELVSTAANVPLTIDRTSGYYNNDESDPVRRLGVMLLENSHFSKSIALAMLARERIQVGLYALLFLLAILYRKTDLAIAATAAQAVFSEQLVSHWLRLEWVQRRFEEVHRQLYTLFQSRAGKGVLLAKVLELYGVYETAKSNAGIALSSKIFNERNAALSSEWDRIKAALKI